MRTAFRRAEQLVFRNLNRVTEPVLRLGLVSPLPGPNAFLLETVGRSSGLPRRVPLLGQRCGRTVRVSTFRPSSQWVRNLEAEPQATVWVNGEPRPATSTVRRVAGGSVVTLQLDEREGAWS